MEPNGTYHRTHAEQNAEIVAYIRWRNAQAEPKTGFTTDSPIRPEPIIRRRQVMD
jgi:hypothetical protein